MRLNEQEIQAIRDAVHRVDPAAEIWLFGSRADAHRRGGDIDIAVLSNRIHRHDRHAILHEICSRIGEQRIDLVVAADAGHPMLALAKETGVPIYVGINVS